MKYRIFIVEDHPIMRLGYEQLIDGEADLDVCGTTDSAHEARQLIPETAPDVVILDLSLKEGTGLNLIKDLQAQCPDLPILVISMLGETLYGPRALQAGARGYLTKQEVGPRVIEAIRKLLSGGVYVSKTVASKILLHHVGKAGATNRSSIEALSDRELAVFEYLGQGLSTKEIAEVLFLSPKTIDSYRSRLKEKLGFITNAELRRHATLWVEAGRVHSNGAFSG